MHYGCPVVCTAHLSDPPPSRRPSCPPAVRARSAAIHRRRERAAEPSSPQGPATIEWDRSVRSDGSPVAVVCLPQKHTQTTAAASLVIRLPFRPMQHQTPSTPWTAGTQSPCGHALPPGWQPAPVEELSMRSSQCSASRSATAVAGACVLAIACCCMLPGQTAPA